MRFYPETIIAYKKNNLLPEEILKLDFFFTFVNRQREDQFLSKLDELQKKLYLLDPNEDNVRPYTIPAFSNIFQISDMILAEKIKIVEEYEKHTVNEITQAENVIERLLDFELNVKKLLPYKECGEDIGNIFELLKHIQRPSLLEKIFRLLKLSYNKNPHFTNNSKYYIEAMHFIRSYFTFFQENKWNYLEFLKSKAKGAKNIGYDLYKGIRDKMKGKDMPLLNVLNDIGKDKDFSDFFNQAIEEYSEKTVPIPALAKKIFNQFQKSYEEFKIDFYRVIGTLYLFKDYISLLTDPSNYTLIYHMAFYTAFSGSYFNHKNHKESEIAYLNDAFVPTTPNLTFIKILVEFKEMFENAEGTNKANLLNVILNLLFTLKINLQFLSTVNTYSDKKIKAEFMELLINPAKNPEQQPGPINRGFLFKLFSIAHAGYYTKIAKQYKQNKNVFLRLNPYEESNDMHAKVLEELLEIFDIIIENFANDNVQNDTENNTFIKTFQTELENFLYGFDFEKYYLYKSLLAAIQSSLIKSHETNEFINNFIIERIYDRWSFLLNWISNHDMIERLKLETDVQYEKLSSIFGIYNAIIVKYKTNLLEDRIYKDGLLNKFVANFKKIKDIAINIIPKRYFLLLEDCLLHLFELTIPTHLPHLAEIAEKAQLREIIPQSLKLLRLQGNRLRILNTIFSTYQGNFLMFRWFVNTGMFTELLTGFLSSTEFHSKNTYTQFFEKLSKFLMEPMEGDMIFAIKIDKIYGEIIDYFVAAVHQESNDFFKVLNNPDYQLYNIALKKQYMKILEFKYVGMFSVYLRMQFFMKNNYLNQMISPMVLPFLTLNSSKAFSTINDYVGRVVIKIGANNPHKEFRATILSILTDLAKKVNFSNYEKFSGFILANDPELDFFRLEKYDEELSEYFKEERLTKLSREYLQFLNYIVTQSAFPQTNPVKEKLDVPTKFIEVGKLLTDLVINMNKLIAQNAIKEKNPSLEEAYTQIKKYNKLLIELSNLLANRFKLLDDKMIGLLEQSIISFIEVFENNPPTRFDDSRLFFKYWLTAQTLNIIYSAHATKKGQWNYSILTKNDNFQRIILWTTYLINNYSSNPKASQINPSSAIFQEFNTLLKNLSVMDTSKITKSTPVNVTNTIQLFQIFSEFYDKISIEKVLLERRISFPLIENVNKMISNILKTTLAARKESEIEQINSILCSKVDEIIQKTSPHFFIFKDCIVIPTPKKDAKDPIIYHYGPIPKFSSLLNDNANVILDHYTSLCVKMSDPLFFTNLNKNDNNHQGLSAIFIEMLKFELAFDLANEVLKSDKLKINFKISSIISSSLAVKNLFGNLDIENYKKDQAKLRDIEFLSKIQKLLENIFEMYYWLITNGHDNGFVNNDEKSQFFSNILDTIIIILQKHNQINSINSKDLIIQCSSTDNLIFDLLYSIFTYDKTQALSFLKKNGLKLLLSRKVDKQRENNSLIAKIIDYYFLNSLPIANWMELEIRRIISNAKDQKVFWKNLECFPIINAFYTLDKTLLETILKKVVSLVTINKIKYITFSKDYDLTKIITNWNTNTTQDALVYIFQNTSAITKEVLNILCNIIIRNHLDNIIQFYVHYNTNSFNPMTEPVVLLDVLLTKYPHLAPLILFKDMSQVNFNLKEFESLGVYKLLGNFETNPNNKKLTFLKYYVRIVFFLYPPIACKLFRAMLCKCGIQFKLQNEGVDLNLLVAIYLLEEIIDILQEEANDPKFFKTIDSVIICHYYSKLGVFVLKKTKNIPNVFDRLRLWHERLINILLKMAHQMAKLDCEAYGYCESFMEALTMIIDMYYKNLFDLQNPQADLTKLKCKYYLNILEIVQKANATPVISDKETNMIYNTQLNLSNKKSKDDQELDYEYNIYKSNVQETEIRTKNLRKLANSDFNLSNEYNIFDPIYLSNDNDDADAAIENTIHVEQLAQIVINYFSEHQYGDSYIQSFVNPYYQKTSNSHPKYLAKINEILTMSLENADYKQDQTNPYAHPLLHPSDIQKKSQRDEETENFHEDVIAILKKSSINEALQTSPSKANDDEEIPEEALKTKNHYNVIFNTKSGVNNESGKTKLKDLIKRVTRKFNHYQESKQLQKFIGNANMKMEQNEDVSKDNIEFINSLDGPEKNIALCIANEEFVKTLTKNLRIERKIYVYHLKKMMNFGEEQNDEGTGNDQPEESNHTNEWNYYQNNDTPYDPSYYQGDYEEIEDLEGEEASAIEGEQEEEANNQERTNRIRSPEDSDRPEDDERDREQEEGYLGGEEGEPYLEGGEEEGEGVGEDDEISFSHITASDIFQRRLIAPRFQNSNYDYEEEEDYDGGEYDNEEDFEGEEQSNNPRRNRSDEDDMTIPEGLLKKKELFNKLYTFDDKLIEGILSYLFTVFEQSQIDTQAASSAITYFRLLSKLMINPIVELKIIDAMLYVLGNPKIYATFQKIDAYSKDPELIFPQKNILNRSLIKNTQDIYTIVANNILHFFNYYIDEASRRNKSIFFLSSNLFKQCFFKYISVLRKNHPTGKKIDEKDISIINFILSALEIEEIKNYKDNFTMVIQILETLFNKSKGIALSDYQDLHNLYLGEDKSFRTIPNIAFISKSSLDYILDQLTPENKETFSPSISNNSNFSSMLIKNLLEPISKDADAVLSKVCKKIVNTYSRDLTPKFENLLISLREEEEPLNGCIAQIKIVDALTEDDANNLNKIGTILRAISDFFSSNLRKSAKKDLFGKFLQSMTFIMDDFIDNKPFTDLLLYLYDFMECLRKAPIDDDNIFYGLCLDVTKGVNSIIIYHFSIVNLLAEMKNGESIIDTITDSEDDRKIEVLPKLSRLVTNEPEIINQQPKLVKTYSQIRGSSERDYCTLFLNFVTGCRPYITEYYFKICEDIFKYEILRLIAKYPMLMGFEYKANEYFRKQMREFQEKNGINDDDRREINIARKKIIQDSMKAFNSKDSRLLLQKVYVNFKREGGGDSGGLRREWITLLTQELLHPNKGLFEITPNGRTIKINPLSSLIPDYQSYYKFLGIILAKAIQEGILIDINFTKSFYKHILGKELTIQDLDDIDPELTKNLNWLLKNHVDDLKQPFTYEIDIMGTRETRELLPNGSNILLTDSNKKDYVKKLCQAKMTDEIKTQLQSFLEGFFIIIPKNMINIFTPSELEMLLSGTKEIDVQLWKQKTRYNDANESDELVQWFWEIITEFDQNARAAFLHFVSGATKLPHMNYDGDFLVVNFDNTNTDQLPTASTCFYEIRMPKYETKEKMKQKIILAAFEGKEGFFSQIKIPIKQIS